MPRLLLSPRDIEDLSSISGQEDNDEREEIASELDEGGGIGAELEGADYSTDAGVTNDSDMDFERDEEEAGRCDAGLGIGISSISSMTSPRTHSPLARGAHYFGA